MNYTENTNYHDKTYYSAHGPRGSEFMDDHSYCVVSAVSAAFNIVFREAHALLASVGRKPRKGYSTCALMGKEKALAPYGEACEAKWFYREGARSWRAGMTIKTFLRECDPGKRYIVTVTGHALAVIGGKVRGESNLNRRVKFIWEVTPKLERPGAINLPAIVNKNLTTLAPCASL